MEQTVEVHVMLGNKEIETIERAVLIYKGQEYIIFHCKFFVLGGWALWERYIDLQEPVKVFMM